MTSLAIPTYTFSVQGTRLAFAPNNLSIANIAGYVALTGDMSES